MHMYVEFMKRKAKSTTWSELGNQNIQGKNLRYIPRV